MRETVEIEELGSTGRTVSLVATITDSPEKNSAEEEVSALKF